MDMRCDGYVSDNVWNWDVMYSCHVCTCHVSFAYPFCVWSVFLDYIMHISGRFV